MEYEINKEYPIEEMKNIEIWWQSHREYDINNTLTTVIIVPRDPKVYARNRIEELTDMLYSTDYVAAKLSEAAAVAQITGNDSELNELYTKYSQTMIDRQNWRTQIREYEAVLNN